jgi:hypothetical protein
MRKFLFVLASTATILAMIGLASAQIFTSPFGGGAVNTGRPNYGDNNDSRSRNDSWREERAQSDWRNNTFRDRTEHEDWRQNDWRKEDWRENDWRREDPRYHR